MESQFNFKQNDEMKTMIAPLSPSVKKYLGKIKYAMKLNKKHIINPAMVNITTHRLKLKSLFMNASQPNMYIQ